MSATMNIHDVKTASMAAQAFPGERSFTTLNISINGDEFVLHAFLAHDRYLQIERAAAAFNAVMAEPAEIAEAAE